MGNRDLGVVALGRFLAVERYRETHLPSSDDRRRPGQGLTAGYADKPDSRSGAQAPGRPQRG